MKTLLLVPDDLWEAIKPLLPKQPPKPQGGRPRVPDRAALGGIVFVLRTGCPWRLLPRELGCGSGTTCWRRLRDWQDARVWERLHTRLLNWLGDGAAIDWSRASLDSVSVRAKRGANKPVPTQRIVAKRGPSTSWSSTGTAFPWPFASRPPTPTTPASFSRWSMRFLRSAGHGGVPVVLAFDRPSCTPTKPTTPWHCAMLSGPGASRRGLRAGASTPVSGWGGTTGWWKAASPGCSAVGASASATSSALTCSRACCTSPAP